MTTTADLSTFVHSTDYDDLSDEVVDAIKKRVLDAVAIAIGSIGAEPVEIVRETVTELDGDGSCRIWGSDGTASPPEAVMMNTALVRYLDYMDAVLYDHETPHPSDTVAAAVATAEYDDRSGADLILGVGLAYEVQCALAEVAGGRDKGWDHIHVTYGSTAAAARLLGLDEEQTRNAFGIAFAAYNPLRVTRTGAISMWKGIASANLSRNAVYTVMLARNGMEGPQDAIEGQKGWKEIVMREDFQATFTPCERVLDVMTKKYVAGTHAQTAIDALLALFDRDDLDAADVDAIEVGTYAGAAHVMGGGEGTRHVIENKEQADHSLPYTLAVAALDGEVTNAQYEPDRIAADDVQSFMQKISIHEDPDCSARQVGTAQPVTIEVTTVDGAVHRIERDSYDGHPMDPISWAALEEKFAYCAGEQYTAAQRAEIVDVIRNLEQYDASDLVALLD